MGCLKLTYQITESPLKVVYRNQSFEQNNAQRFLRIDPFSEITLGETPYHYVSNNPISHTDPYGLFKVYVNGERVRGKKKKAVLNEYGLGKKKKKKNKDGGDKSPSELVGGDNYARGALVLNEYVAYQANGDGTFRDLSFNPSIGPHNKGTYLYSSHDLAVRRALFEDAPNNPITVQILINEQKGIYTPLSNEDYVNNFYEVYGSDANPSFYLGAQILAEAMPGPDGFNSSLSRNSARQYRMRSKRAARSMRRAGIKSKFGQSNPAIKNKWNKFLNKNKGVFKGKNWLQNARKAYYNGN